MSWIASATMTGIGFLSTPFVFATTVQVFVQTVLSIADLEQTADAARR